VLLLDVLGPACELLLDVLWPRPVGPTGFSSMYRGLGQKGLSSMGSGRGLSVAVSSKNRGRGRPMTFSSM
jgi:hypothetical protein